MQSTHVGRVALVRQVGSVLAAVVVALVVTFGGALALPSAARAAGNVADGKAKSVACQACHVASASDTPHLAGQREAYLAKQLKAFKAGERKNPLMSAIATQLSDTDIENLATYWGAQNANSDNNLSEAVSAIRKSQMPFPKEFPKGYVLYDTVKKDDQNAVSKSYINTLGLAAAKAGKPLPDGTSILVVNYAAKLDANKKPVAAKDGSWEVDKVMSYAGMESRAGWGKDIPELLRNNNWNYGVFGPDKATRGEINQAVCLACHKPKSASSFVFGIKEIDAAAKALK
ncbi:MAG: cytochrome P460 family protein [Myxococcales bacterium]|nr:cytochrome P460 family protein [Myxococcales bacterium]